MNKFWRGVVAGGVLGYAVAIAALPFLPQPYAAYFGMAFAWTCWAVAIGVCIYCAWVMLRAGR
jgi:hypothetical protein